MMNIKLKRGTVCIEWSGRTDREVFYSKGVVFEGVVDVGDGYEWEDENNVLTFIPKENSVVL